MIELCLFRRKANGVKGAKVSTTAKDGASIASFWIRGGNSSKELGKMKTAEAGKIVAEQKSAMA